MDCRVVVEAAVPVYDVSTEEEAVRIAISKTGEMLNPDLNYVEIEMAERTGPDGTETLPAFIAADEALVALELEMTVFNVERDEHAARIARKEIGDRLENIPLKVLVVTEVVDEDDEDDGDDGDDETAADDGDAGGGGEGEGGPDDGTAASPGSDAAEEGTTGDDGGPGEGADDEDVLPEFDELLEDER